MHLLKRLARLGPAFVILLLALSATTTPAQVQPDDVIGPSSAAKVKDLVSPGVYQQVQQGIAMKIVETQHIDWPAPYKAATEKYSGQVKLSADGASLSNYTAGLPFPNVDANDPKAATKLMWNTEFRPVFTDDYDLRFVDCEFSYIAGSKAGQTLQSMQLGHYSGYSLVNRVEVAPTPTDPDFQSSGRYWLFAMYPVLAPAELQGGGLVRFRYADPAKPDDAWAWNPGTRRVRQLDDSMLVNPSGIGAWSPDHFAGFNSKLEEYTYKFLGQKEMLGSFHARAPADPCVTGAQCADAWEMRKLYIVEATPKRAEMFDPGTKMVVYLDAETYFPPYIDIYKGKGELLQSEIYWLAYADRSMPNATVAVYPFNRQFLIAAAAYEADNALITKCFLPGSQSQDQEGWYINSGSLDRNFFTQAAMNKAAD